MITCYYKVKVYYMKSTLIVHCITYNSAQFNIGTSINGHAPPYINISRLNYTVQYKVRLVY